jgi:hypothetical protein
MSDTIENESEKIISEHWNRYAKACHRAGNGIKFG